MKATFLLKKILKSWFDEFFGGWFFYLHFVSLREVFLDSYYRKYVDWKFFLDIQIQPNTRFWIIFEVYSSSFGRLGILGEHKREVNCFGSLGGLVSKKNYVKWTIVWPLQRPNNSDQKFVLATWIRPAKLLNRKNIGFWRFFFIFFGLLAFINIRTTLYDPATPAIMGGFQIFREIEELKHCCRRSLQAM